MAMSALYCVQCRICLSTEKEMNSIYEIFIDGVSLAELIKKYTLHDLQEHVTLPSKICTNCKIAIVKFHELMVIFLQNEAYLMSQATEKDVLNCGGVERDPFNDEPSNEEQFHTATHLACESLLAVKSPIVDFDELDNLSETETIDDVEIESHKYTCQECGDIYLRKSGFQHHMLLKHKKYLQKTDCECYCTKIKVKIPQSNTYSANNIKIPTGKSKKNCIENQCKICNEIFSTTNDLQAHYNIHKSHICSECGSTFLKKSYLADHLLIHSTVKRYRCNICDKAYTQRSGLVRHLNIHETSKTFQCETCGQGFNNRDNLRVHIRAKHTKEKNYRCSECNLSFTVKAWMDKHFLRKHTSRTKSFVCYVCSMAYMEKATLNRHISEKHSGKDPIKHPCTACEKTYIDKFKLTKHLQNKHDIILHNK